MSLRTITWRDQIRRTEDICRGCQEAFVSSAFSQHWEDSLVSDGQVVRSVGAQ
jgi:hypothetical protein